MPATLSGKTRKAAKLKNAAQITARWGLSTRVETTVAIELAVSWKPFRKSKTSASRIRSQTTRPSSPHPVKVPNRISSKCMGGAPSSRSLDHDLRQHVGGGLARVHRLFQPVVQLAQLDQRQDVRRLGEQGAFRLAVQSI